MQASPILEPYDASIDPWNEPELSQPATVASPDVRRPRPTCGTAYPSGLLNPGATAFYPMVPGANCFQRAGGTSEPSPEPAPGLPHFGLCPQADLTPFTLASPLEAHPRSAGGVPTNTNVPNNGMHNCAFPEGQLVSPGLFFPKAAAKGSFEKSVAIKDCHQSSAEVMAVFKDCNQTLPKVLLE